MNNKGILVVISGFSGSGKGTVINALMKKHPDDYAFSISATTRSPRPGEENGVHYFFLNKEEFEEMIKNDELIEYAQYVGNYYGTPRKYVEEQLNLGKSVILDIEIQGALLIKEKMPEARFIFLTPPGADELKNRLVGRGTETEDVIIARMARSYEESGFMNKYDYLVIYDVLEECVDLTHTLITNEKSQNAKAKEEHLTSSNIEFINKMRTELLSFSKGE